MNGIVSRPRTTHIPRILRALIVLAIVACAVVAVAPTVGASPAHASTMRPYYVECANVTWQDTDLHADGGSSHVMIDVRVQQAVDIHDFAFCDELRTHLYFSQTAGYCDYIYASVYYGSNHGTVGGYTCADGGGFYSDVYYSNCGSARGWDTRDGVVELSFGRCY